MSLALLFPGQGSQIVGMGKDLAAHYPQAKAVFDEVDAVLGQHLSAMMFNGPSEDLTATANAQPALMAVSIALCRVLEAQGWCLAEHAKFVAGHSLGEYTALCATGVLSLADTARLLRQRGEAMQKAIPLGEGAMAAILGSTFADVEALLAATQQQDGVCVIANDNGEGQVVISGATAAVERALEAAPAHGIKKAIRLPVSAPFHCPLMAPAAEVMAQALAQVTFSKPCVPVVTNITAQPLTDPETLRQGLVDQVTGRVRWRETMDTMVAQGITTFVEVGAGAVLTGLVKRAVPQAARHNLHTPSSVEDFLALFLDPQVLRQAS